MPRVELGQTNIIFNIPHPSVLLHIHDKSTRNTLLLLIQETKRDNIYRRMNMPTPTPLCTTSKSNPTSWSTSKPSPQILQGHWDSVTTSSNQPCLMWPCIQIHDLHPPSCHDKIFLSPANTILPIHNLHTYILYRRTKSQERTIRKKPALWGPLYNTIWHLQIHI